VYILTQNIYFW